MFMLYITGETAGKEMLMTVCGEEDNAKRIIESLQKHYWIDTQFRIRSLNQLFDNHVKIPLALKWIVKSDKKYQEREVEDRTKNLMGLNFS